MNVETFKKVIRVGIQKQHYNFEEVKEMANFISSKYKNVKVDLQKVEKLSEANVDVLVSSGQFIAADVENFPKTIKWVQCTWAGLDSIVHMIDKNPIHKQCVFTRLGGTFTYPMAEYTLAAVIGMEKKFPLLYENQKCKIWRCEEDNSYFEHLKYRELNTLSLGIMGVGDIGMVIAKSFKNLGMTVYGLAKSPKSSEYLDKCYTTNDLKVFLSNCDYICNVLPSTPETVGLLSGNVLEVCKQKSPGFINIGRGDIISEQSILNAIENKWISSAYLDVFEVEPLPSSSLLWKTENVFITPHVAGLTTDYKKIFLENLDNFINQKSLKYVFNWQKLY